MTFVLSIEPASDPDPAPSDIKILKGDFAGNSAALDMSIIADFSSIAGRYILTPEIYTALEQTSAGRNNEIQLTDALMNLTRKERVVSHTIQGKRYDIGNKLDYLKIKHASITDKTIANLKSLPDLAKFDVFYCNITNEG